MIAGLDYRDEQDCLVFGLGQPCYKYLQLKRELTAAKQRISQLEKERDDEKEIVNRIWQLFGSPSYEELSGKSIYDLVYEAIEGRDEAAAKALEGAAIRGRIAQLEGKLVDVEIRAMKPGPE